MDAHRTRPLTGTSAELGQTALVQIFASLWCSGAAPPRGREWSLPTGRIHVVLRLGDDGVRVFEALDAPEQRLPPAIVGGPRTRAWLRTPSTAASVGFELPLGTCRSVLGVPASELRDKHTALDDVVPWARALREQLQNTRQESRLEVLTGLLRARTQEARDPLVDFVVGELAAGNSVGEVVRRTGRSHRTVLSRFEAAIGLSPSELLGLWRFQRTVRQVARRPEQPLADVALELGYADQAHLARRFKAHAQLTLSVFRANHVPGSPNHVRVPSTSFKTR